MSEMGDLAHISLPISAQIFELIATNVQASGLPTSHGRCRDPSQVSQCGGAAARLWCDGHFREAVFGAAEAVALMVKTRTKCNDIAEAALWQQVFSDRDPQPGQPRLRWPGDPNDRDISSMNAGLRLFAPASR